MERVRWDGRKWPDRPHWQYEMHALGEDDHGIWLHVPDGTLAQRGDAPPSTLEFGFVCLVTRDEWWTAEFYRDHPWLSCYVNIGTPCVWTRGSVVQIDLDLDVIRRVDGSVEIIDEDEFASHQVLHGYPQRLIDGGRAAADRMRLALHENRDPFTEAAERWLTAARPHE